ncbi:MAG: hypothetical protein IJB79_07280 [Candidatus Gastranaerophilales bacterium]|nr:hypothetical protein [Candidatus Gastranaerophilales bacterium]
MDKNKIKSKEEKAQEMQNKLEKMRFVLTDEQKCKEIAQKLCAYINKNS